jgi:hypothetical protein
MSISIDKELSKQLELVKWIDVHFKIKLPADRKSILAVSCFDLTIEHHAAIYTLCKSQLYGPMFALSRILFESYVRGLWLRYSAGSREIEKYEKDKLEITFGAMIASVESSIKIASGPLSSLKSSSWKMMNSFTHSGFQHLLRRNANGVTGPINYDDKEVCSVLNLAGTFSLLSAIELATFADNQELIDKARLKVEEYAVK